MGCVMIKRLKVLLFFIAIPIIFFVSCPDTSPKVDSTIEIIFHSNNSVNQIEIQKMPKGKTSNLMAFPFYNIGYKFLGWSTDSLSGKVMYADEEQVTFSEDTNLYAIWYRPTITFLSNDENNQIKTQTISYAPISSYLTPNTFSRSIHRFKGWTTEKNGNIIVYNDNASVCLDHDLVLYAVWEEITEAHVIFYPNFGNKEPKKQVVPLFTKFILDVNTFERPDYIFLGWSTKKSGVEADYSDGEEIFKGPSCESEGIDRDLELYAVWKAKTKHTISFYPNINGINEPSSKITQSVIENEYTKLRKNTFTNSGYLFSGWSNFSDGRVALYLDEEEVSLSLDLDLFAIWYRPTITYHKNTDNNDESITEEVNYNTPVELKSDIFSLVDYGILGWTDNKESKIPKYFSHDTVSFTSDVDLYAIWFQPTVTFYANNGTGEEKKQVVKYNTRTTLDMNNFIYNFYNFKGWSTELNSNIVSYTDCKSIQLTSDINLYAVWEKKTTADITFIQNNPDGEDTVSKTQTVLVDKSEKLEPNTFVCLGYKFLGWDTDKDSENILYENEDDITLSDDITLYAKWEYTGLKKVIFNSNNELSVTDEQNVTCASFNKLRVNSFEYFGYKFLGWNTDREAESVQYSDAEEIYIEDDLVLYAVWEKIENVRIVYYSNNDTDKSVIQIFPFNELFTLDSNKFTYDGYKFLGWNTDENAENILYEDEQQIKITEDLILYAVWYKPTITFKANGGTGKDFIQCVSYDTSIRLTDFAEMGIKEPFMMGFNGWGLDGADTVPAYSDGENIRITEDLVLYAIWKEYDTPFVITSDGTITGYLGTVPKKLIIPSYVGSIQILKIGDMVFTNNNDLEELIISDGITEVSEVAFASCDNLKLISLGSTLKIISDGAFAYCTSLESIELPNSLEYIGESAFSNCIELENITYKGTKTQYQHINKRGNIFYGCKNTVPVFLD